MSFVDMSLAQFAEALASDSPTPGGGSSAALAGALGAALVSMVCRLTIGRKGYEDAAERLSDVLEEADALRSELLALLDEDTQAYAAVMAAYRLPRKSPADRLARKEAMREATIQATEVPLRIGEACAQVLALALPAAEAGNSWAVSDAAAGAALAEAGMRAALLNVEINVANLGATAYAAEARARAQRIQDGKELLRTQVQQTALERMRL